MSDVLLGTHNSGRDAPCEYQGHAGCERGYERRHNRQYRGAGYSAHVTGLFFDAYGRDRRASLASRIKVTKAGESVIEREIRSDAPAVLTKHSSVAGTVVELRSIGLQVSVWWSDRKGSEIQTGFGASDWNSPFSILLAACLM